ncbi:MAG: diaminopimelate epimerase [Schwartzia sp.]|nr:diaminopimelate epimerase [Schwartzia sp. (in: firmicutes)]
MDIHFVKASPCRNTTVFLEGDVRPEDYAAIANLAMDSDYLAAEQAGFLAAPRDDGAVLRLEMAGGEFCGNATLALAALAVTRGLAEVETEFLVECSGAETPLACVVEARSRGRYLVGAEMPGAQSVTPLTIPAAGREFSGGLVELPGIRHFCFAADVPPTRREYDAILDALFASGEAGAYGVIPYQRQGTACTIRPYVGVADTKSRVFEQACGSGSLALGIWLGRDGDGRFTVSQPGGTIAVEPGVPSIAATVYFPCEGNLFVPEELLREDG